MKPDISPHQHLLVFKSFPLLPTISRDCKGRKWT